LLQKRVHFFAKESKFWSKIQKKWSKIEILGGNQNFGQKYKKNGQK